MRRDSRRNLGKGLKMRTRHILRSSIAPVLVLLALMIGVAISRAQDNKNREESSRAVRAFVTNWGGTDVSVIDPERGRLIASIKTGSQPHGVAIAPDGRAVYGSNEGDGTLSFIDPAKNEVLATIHVGKSPNQLEVSADGKYVFVTRNGADSLAVVDGAARQIMKSVSVGRG